MDEQEWDAQRHLAAELARLAAALHLYLGRQRGRGRTLAADLVGGHVVEEGEAEGLVAELHARWTARAGRAQRSAERPAGDNTRKQIAACVESAAAAGKNLPLRHAALAFRLTVPEYDAVLLALGTEIDATWGRLCGYLNDHVGRTRPTLGLAIELAASERADAAASPPVFCDRPIARDGLLELEGDGPLPGLALRVPHAMLRRLVGLEPLATDATEYRLFPHEPQLLARLVLEPAVRSRAQAWAALGRRQANAPLLVVGAPGSGRAALGRAAAGLETARGSVLVELHAGADVRQQLRQGRREARWHGAALLIETKGAEADKIDWESLWQGLREHAGPSVVLTTPDLLDRAVSSAPGPPVVVQLATPALADRVRLWRSMAPESALADAELGALAARFAFGAGTVASVVRDASIDAALQSPPSPTPARLDAGALARACRAHGARAMGSLAQKLPLPYQRKDLILPARLVAELDLALAWVREQHHVMHHWGFGQRVALGRGLTALFAGPPGTGKTMAAQVLGRELDVDVYRVDLSRVMSKWIGETEKNLGQLFDEAHAAGALLFFDEADALFGKRSEVKQALDRYANVEVGYLLQRIEEHEGITILASNRMADLDEAFVRRFHFILDFPLPAPAERLRIWSGMFPEQAERATGLDLRRLADKFEISGGEIRNAVLAAAYLAAAEGQPIGASQLLRGLRRELKKNGRVVDEAGLAGS